METTQSFLASNGMTPEENIPLSEHTTFKVGGFARYFFYVKTIEEAHMAVDFARSKKLSFFVLGGGSNLLVSDEGYQGVIIKNGILGQLFREDGEDMLAEVGAGENWDDFVVEVVKRNLFGIENLSGIPGTVGASPVQNIGAYGVEAGDWIVSVTTFDARTGEPRVFNKDECRFAYRDSFFKTAEGKNFVIISVMFRFKKQGVINIEYKDLKNYFVDKATPALLDVRKAVLEIRRGKFPDLKTTGTAGSFFKNPIISQDKFNELKKKYPNLPGFDLGNGLYKISLAWILDNVIHCMGLRLGEVGLHHAQPLVLINNGKAQASEVSALAFDLMKKIREATGVTVAWEVERL